MSYINQTWYRIILEVVQCKTANQEKVIQWVHEVIQVQIDQNLRCQQEEVEDHDSEGSEDFHKGQLTKKADDFDQFAKVLRQRVEFSIPILLDRVNYCVLQYE